MQIAYKWDNETVRKSLKGLLFAILGGAGLGFFNWIGTIHVDNPLLAEVLVTLLPGAAHTFYQWIRGKGGVLPPGTV
jgi:hypothetical protein